MKQFDDGEPQGFLKTFLPTILMFGLGTGILGFLVAIDRPDWFHIRPTSGTAVALSNAGSIHERVEAIRR